MIEKTLRDKIINLVRREVVPAIGCTEPIAVALLFYALFPAQFIRLPYGQQTQQQGEQHILMKGEEYRAGIKQVEGNFRQQRKNQQSLQRT